MRKFYLAILAVCVTSISFSQIITEVVNFNNYVSSTDNDLVNKFYGMQALTNIPDSGITGGSLTPPDSNNWGNDNSIYCSKYDVTHGTPYSTSICFQFDSSLVSATGFDRAVSIWHRPHNDPNHYIIATVSHESVIEVYTYGSFDHSSSMAFTNGNWYRLRLDFNLPLSPNPYFVLYNTTVFDLGPTGTSTPVLVDSVGMSMIDTVFASDQAVEVSITGARFGGTARLDDFKYEGIKSADSCLTLGLTEHNNTQLVVRYISGEGKITIEGLGLSGKSVCIYDLNGKIVFSERLNADKNIFNADLKNGIYVLRVDDFSSQKFSVLK